MIGGAFSLQQLLLSHFPFRIKLANADLFLVGKTRGHRPAGNQNRRYMAKAKRADQQAGHDLVANAQRSEEHTSELQSLMRISYAVFCLKKTNTTQHIQHTKKNPHNTKHKEKHSHSTTHNTNTN